MPPIHIAVVFIITNSDEIPGTVTGFYDNLNGGFCANLFRFIAKVEEEADDES